MAARSDRKISSSAGRSRSRARAAWRATGATGCCAWQPAILPSWLEPGSDDTDPEDLEWHGLPTLRWDAPAAFAAAKAVVETYLLARNVAADIAGVTEIYRVGGVQAAAALAYGTKTIPKVDKIVGPGNAWVTATKARSVPESK